MHVSLEANIKIVLFQLLKITNITTVYIKWLEYKHLCVRIYVTCIDLNTGDFMHFLKKKNSSMLVKLFISMFMIGLCYW